jgi:hypothetical protein
VQTFLPYPDFGETARVLDPKRLGNQRSEALVILRVCRIPTYGWQHHPAVRMWRGHEDALICYRVAICDRGTASGYADTVKEKLLEYSVDRSVSAQHELAASGRLPPWLGDPRLHQSHQSALLRKNPRLVSALIPRRSGQPPVLLAGLAAPGDGPRCRRLVPWAGVGDASGELPGLDRGAAPPASLLLVHVSTLRLGDAFDRNAPGTDRDDPPLPCAPPHHKAS